MINELLDMLIFLMLVNIPALIMANKIMALY